MTDTSPWTEKSIEELQKLQVQGLSSLEIGSHPKCSQISVAQQPVLMGLPIKLVESRRRR